MAKDKRLSEVLTIEDLSKYGNKVCIVSGVGSGKNYWVEHELTKHGNVLLVTSRKIVKDQTLTKDFFTEKANWYGENYKVCTHSSIGKFVRDNTHPLRGLDELIFDYIVIDEAHSVVSDAVFSEDSNYLWQFINNVKSTIILMTATVTWIKEMIIENNFKIIDKTNECINLKPKKIEIILHKKAIDILEEASSCNKIMYMLPYAREAYKIEEDFINMGRDDIVAITSTSRGIKNKQSEREKTTYEALVSNKRFPDDVNIIITTTKLREGVNIEDDRIKTCIAGCHTSVDIRQFAGRFRTGIETMYIVDDKKQHENNVDKFELDASSKLLSEFDEVIEEFLNLGFGEKPEFYVQYYDCMKFSQLIEKKFSLVKFNRYSNRFELYKQRIIACEREKKDLENFKSHTWEYLRNIFGEGVAISLRNKKGVNQAIEDKCIQIITEYLNQPLDLEKMNYLLKVLTDFGFKNSKGKEYSNLGSAVSSLGYKLQRHGNHNNNVKILVEKQN